MAEEETEVLSGDRRKKRRVMQRDFNRLAEEITQEHRDRKDRRKDLEKDWDEIDRQVAMRALDPSTRANDGTDRKWMAAVEMPWQSSALDVLPKDTMRLIFPPGDDWYDVHVVLTDAWANRIKGIPLLAGVENDSGIGTVDQGSADMIVKSALEHYHSRYNFRLAWKDIINEAVKYGTYCGRVGLVDLPVFSNDYRGPRGRKEPVPAIIPTSIRNTYLDDSIQHALHEGRVIRPSVIRTWWQKLEDLRRAAKMGVRADENAGWMPAQLNKMEARSEGKHKGQVELLEMEGDIVIDREDGVIFLPGWIVTVAVGNNARVVRFRESKLPFLSYIHGVYDHDDITKPYGSCPLLKGRPLQVGGTEIANRMINAAALDAEPAVLWDKDDTQLLAQKGPVIAPGTLNASDNPQQSVVLLKGGDVSSLFTTWQGMKQSYEETLHIQDPRRGADVKSHTSGFSNQLVMARSLLPTEDFALDVEAGPGLTWLYMHYELVKLALKRPTIVYVNARGVDGHFELTKDHLDVQVNFTMRGARGRISHEQKQANFVSYYKILMETAPLKAQAGAPLPNFAALDAELAATLDITDAARFFEGEDRTAPDSTGTGANPDDAIRLLEQFGQGQ